MNVVDRLLSKFIRILINTPRHINRKTMSTFVSRTSPVTGKVEWIQQDDNYDYIQEIARSAYADMLHDTERNRKYYEGLRIAVKMIHERGQSARVLDIGTGTGLLSMMAVVCGADSVTACEAFEPMASCARQVMEDNGFSSKIKLISKRSTDVTVGPDGDMEERANILVTEVYDTELIGEGAIPTFHHAHKCLLQKDCIVVPTAANLYVQLVNSDFIRRFNQFQPIHMSATERLDPPTDVTKCPGAAAVHDIQMDQLTTEQFTPVTDPVRVFRFDYSGKSPIEFKGYSKTEVSAVGTGTVDAVFMWWDLQMAPRGDIMLSCAPRWAHPEPDNMQWRDHWMQAVYYPAHQVAASVGEKLVIHSCHDDYSLWFDVGKPNCVANNNLPVEVPVCQCGAHVACSRSRLAMINDTKRQGKFLSALKTHIKPDSVCLCLSDTSLLAIMAAKLGAKHVYTLEPHSMGAKLIQKFASHNNLENLTVLQLRPEELTDDHLKHGKITTLLTEPFFTTTLLPWDNLYFFYARTELQRHLVEQPTVLPGMATLRGIGVQFDDLWKIRAPVGNCEGFDLGHFDRLIESACTKTDAYLEPQPLWEYPCKPMTDVFSLMGFDFTKPLQGIKTIDRKGILEINRSGTINGVVVWIDFNLDSASKDRDNLVSYGLLHPPKTGENLLWDPCSKQAVHLLRAPVHIDLGNAVVSTGPDGDNGKSKMRKWRLGYKILFRPSTGDFEFDFNVTSHT